MMVEISAKIFLGIIGASMGLFETGFRIFISATVLSESAADSAYLIRRTEVSGPFNFVCILQSIFSAFRPYLGSQKCLANASAHDCRHFQPFFDVLTDFSVKSLVFNIFLRFFFPVIAEMLLFSKMKKGDHPRLYFGQKFGIFLEIFKKS